MKLLIVITLFIHMQMSVAGTHLVLFGGGERSEPALDHLTNIAQHGRFLVVTWATQDPQTFDAINRQLIKRHVKSVETSLNDVMTTDDMNFTMQQIQNADAIYFTGGNQQRIFDVFTRFPNIRQLMRSQFAQGKVFSGTSAGTAIMSKIALTGDADLTRIDSRATVITEGLGLLPEHVVVDQHFIVRSRFNRLASVVLQNINSIGIGVDENHALYIKNSREVIPLGPGQSLIMKATTHKKLEVTLLMTPQTFEL